MKYVYAEEYELRVTPDGNERWVKKLVEKPNLKCTASIIDEKYVLTAGHCLKEDIDLTNYTIITGTTDLNRNNPKEKFNEYTFDRSDVIVHPLYLGVCNQLFLTGEQKLIKTSLCQSKYIVIADILLRHCHC